MTVLVDRSIDGWVDGMLVRGIDPWARNLKDETHFSRAHRLSIPRYTYDAYQRNEQNHSEKKQKKRQR